MALIDKNVKAIEKDPELQAKLRELWDRDAPVSEFYDALTAAGLEVTMENLEDTHEALQKRRGEKIADLEKVDLELLSKVAGGGAGVDCTEANDCDKAFKREWYWDSNKERCYVDSLCDQYFN